MHGDVLQLNLQELIDQVTHAAEAMQQQQQDAASSSSSSPPGQEAQSPQRSKRRKVKVVANLPYNITKDFLVAMFPKGDLIAELSIMIQVVFEGTPCELCGDGSSAAAVPRGALVSRRASLSLCEMRAWPCCAGAAHTQR